MIDLREHLQELADAATRDGSTPGPAAAVRRGRQRRRRIAAATASLLVVALVAGGLLSGRLPVRTTSRPVGAGGPHPTNTGRQSLNARRIPGYVQAPWRRAHFGQLATELRRCPGGSSIPADLIGYVWSAKYRRHRRWSAAKQPPPSETRVLLDRRGGSACKKASAVSGAREGRLQHHPSDVHQGNSRVRLRADRRPGHQAGDSGPGAVPGRAQRPWTSW